jgi:RHS repeat-associated protein
MGGTWGRTGLPQALASATYDAANQILTFGGVSFTYDANGNLTNDGSKTYTWNARNELAALGGSVSAAFEYDGVGRRRTKAINGAGTVFLYDGLNLVQEITGGSPSGNLLSGLTIDEIFTRTTAGGVEHLLADVLGSTVALTDSAGSAQTQYTYEPFGAVASTGVQSSNLVLFTGRESDGTGLSFFRARYQAPPLHRFVSEDPLSYWSGDLNNYAYVGGNPVNWRDPLGLARDCGCGGDPLACVAKCIVAHDPLSPFGKAGLTAAGGTVPKSWLGLPKGLGGASPVTTVPSALANLFGGGAAGTVGAAARAVGRVASPVWIGYGLYLFGMEVYCVTVCAGNNCAF